MGSPRFVILYRWRLKPGHEQAFVEAWSSVTQALLARGSRGSRLHRGDDGIWYAYAQWPSEEARRSAFASSADHIEASSRMIEAVAEHFPEVVLTIESDFLAV